MKKLERSALSESSVGPELALDPLQTHRISQIKIQKHPVKLPMGCFYFVFFFGLTLLPIGYAYSGYGIDLRNLFYACLLLCSISIKIGRNWLKALIGRYWTRAVARIKTIVAKIVIRITNSWLSLLAKRLLTIR